MTALRRLLASVAIATAAAMPASAQDASTVVASVDGVDITLGHVIALRERLPQQFQNLPNEQLFQGILEQLINQELLAASTRDAMSRRMALTVENESRAIVASILANQFGTEAVTEEALQAAYAEATSGFVPEPEFNASHILVGTQEEAQAILARLAEGEDFAELARTESTGPSGANGGNLGWFGLGQMVPPFEAAVVSLDVGGLSEPVETQFGWHVVILNDRRESAPQPIEQLSERLSQQISETAISDKLDALRASAEVTSDIEGIDPAIIRNGDLLDE